MRKWLHRAKIAFIGVPIMAFVALSFLFLDVAVAIAASCRDNEGFWKAIRDEWNHGWLPCFPECDCDLAAGEMRCRSTRTTTDG